jgi:hypothetical protein
VFRREHARITTRRFPHSDIPGSTVGQHLPRAYRSRPRPSSALGAKASTVCSCSLDHEEHLLLPLWSFQGAAGVRAHEKQRPPEGRSLKTQQRDVEVDIRLGEPAGLDDQRSSTVQTPIGVGAPISLERR